MRIATGGVTWGGESAYAWCKPPPFDVMLDEMVAAGYRAIERSTNFPEDQKVVRRLLDDRDMTFVGAWSWVDLIDRATHADEIARVRAFGQWVKDLQGEVVLLSDPFRPHRIAIAGRVTAADALTEGQHQAMVTGLNRVGEALTGLGLRAVYHPHAGTCVETRAETDRLMADLDPALVGYCPDTGHIAYAGDDPAAAIIDYADRIRHIHLKDVDGPALQRARAERADPMETIRRGVFTPLGEGTVDMRGALRALKDAGYNGWLVIEQDAAANPLADAVTSREFMESVLAD